MIFFLPVSIFHFLKAALFFALGIGKETDHYYAGQQLLTRSNYRIPEYAKFDNFYLGRAFKRAFILSLKNRFVFYERGKTLEPAIYDTASKSDVRIRFVNFISSRSVKICINKSELYRFSSVGESILSLFFLFPLILFLIPFSLFSKNRVNWAILPDEVIAGANLLSRVKRQKANTLFKFVSLENASGVLSCMLMANNIEVKQIVAEGSLVYLGKVLIADEAIFCFPFQVIEKDRIGPGFRVKKFALWTPENICEWIKPYLNSSIPKTFDYDLGYYSSAYWLRKRRGDASPGFGEVEDSEALESCLLDFLKTNNHLSMRIYLHPREKEPEFIEDAIRYYNDFFEGVNFSIASKDILTLNTLYECNIGVSMGSTVSLERLYVGMKSFFFAPSLDPPPIPLPEGQGILIKTQNEFFEKVNRWLDCDENSFFIETRVGSWRLSESPLIDQLKKYFLN